MTFKEMGKLHDYRDTSLKTAQIYVNQQVTKYIIGFWCVVGVVLLCIAIL